MRVEELVVVLAAGCACSNAHGGQVFNVLDYGAVGDGVTDDTEAIAKAFAACSSSRTSNTVILFPSTSGREESGDYLSGPLQLACNDSTVLIETGATLRARNSTAGWGFGPDCPEPAQGRTPKQMAPLLHISHGKNIRISGGGTIDGSGEMWWSEACGNWWCPAGVPHDQPTAFRPFLLRIDDSEDITVDNVSMRNPGFWNLVPVHSNRITITNVNVTGEWGPGWGKKDPFKTPNTDGFEPMWSTNVHVKGCRVKNGDDCITIKSGSSNVLVEDLYCEHGDGLTIGSVWYDDVTNVTYRNVVMNGTHNGPMIKGRSQGNATVSDITFEDITLIGVYLGLTVDCVYETQGSVDKNIGVLARNITFKNITGTVVGSGKGGGNGAVGGDPSFLVDAAGTFICDPARPCSIKLVDVDIAQLHPEQNKTAPVWLCNHTQLIEGSSNINPSLNAKCLE